jgi:hypothetical protein
MQNMECTGTTALVTIQWTDAEECHSRISVLIISAGILTLL